MLILIEITAVITNTDFPLMLFKRDRIMTIATVYLDTNEVTFKNNVF